MHREIGGYGVYWGKEANRELAAEIGGSPHFGWWEWAAFDEGGLAFSSRGESADCVPGYEKLMRKLYREIEKMGKMMRKRKDD